MERKYQIGKFSELTGISVRTLRYYDDENVLKPEIVDMFTGYRYYTDKNLEEAKIVNSMKYLGFSLEEISKYKNNITSDLLEYKIEEINRNIDELVQKKAILESMCNQYKKNENPKVLKLHNDQITY